MSLIFTVIVTLVVGSQAFLPSLISSNKRSSLSMAVIDPGFPGQLAPVGFFDPLGLSSKDYVSDKEVKKWRESEIKHGRICMLAAIGILVAEVWHPLYDLPLRPRILGAAINHFQQWQTLNPGEWFIPLVIVFFLEAKSIAKGWETARDTKSGIKIASLKDEYIPGDLEFDPLNLRPKTYDGYVDMRNKELNNGRLGMAAQELVDGKSIWGHFIGSNPAFFKL